MDFAFKRWIFIHQVRKNTFGVTEADMKIEVK